MGERRSHKIRQGKSRRLEKQSLTSPSRTVSKEYIPPTDAEGQGDSTTVVVSLIIEIEGDSTKYVWAVIASAGSHKHLDSTALGTASKLQSRFSHKWQVTRSLQMGRSSTQLKSSGLLVNVKKSSQAWTLLPTFLS